MAVQLRAALRETLEGWQEDVHQPWRDVIADAAKTQGWLVCEYDVKTVFAEAAKALGLEDISVRMKEIDKSIGPPWQKNHKLATAATIVAAKACER